MKLIARWILPLIGLFAIGCGGSGDNSLAGGGGGGGNSKVAVFATDAPSPNFAHVWVTVYSISLVPTSGSPVTVFDSPTGLTIDARSLRDATGQIFQFIDAAGVPAGTYKSVNIVVGNQVIVAQPGQTTTTTLTLTGGTDLGNGKEQFNLNFAQPFNAQSGRPIVIDFDLANSTISGTTINLVLHASNNGNGLGDQHRHKPSHIVGTVSGLAGTIGNQTFTLTNGGHSFNVATDQNTILFNENGTPNPLLGNGEMVRVVGTWVNGQFVAKEIHILPSSFSNLVEGVGTFSNLNPAIGTFDLTLQDSNFAPQNILMHVVTDANTAFISAGGVTEPISQFFTDLANAPTGSLVEVIGTVNGTTINANAVRLLPPATVVVPRVMVFGPTSNVNATNGTLDLTINGWEGFPFTSGQTIHVVSNGNTTYKLNGQMVSAADWFAALAANPTANVKAFGFFSNGTLTATRLVLGQTLNGGDDDNGDDDDKVTSG